MTVEFVSAVKVAESPSFMVAGPEILRYGSATLTVNVRVATLTFCQLVFALHSHTSSVKTVVPVDFALNFA